MSRLTTFLFAVLNLSVGPVGTTRWNNPYSRLCGQWHWVLWWLSVSDLFIVKPGRLMHFSKSTAFRCCTIFCQRPLLWLQSDLIFYFLFIVDHILQSGVAVAKQYPEDSTFQLVDMLSYLPAVAETRERRTSVLTMVAYQFWVEKLNSLYLASSYRLKAGLNVPGVTEIRFLT